MIDFAEDPVAEKPKCEYRCAFVAPPEFSPKAESAKSEADRFRGRVDYLSTVMRDVFQAKLDLEEEPTRTDIYFPYSDAVGVKLRGAKGADAAEPEKVEVKFSLPVPPVEPRDIDVEIWQKWNGADDEGLTWPEATDVLRSTGGLSDSCKYHTGQSETVAHALRVVKTRVRVKLEKGDLSLGGARKAEATFLEVSTEPSQPTEQKGIHSATQCWVTVQVESKKIKKKHTDDKIAEIIQSCKNSAGKVKKWVADQRVRAYECSYAQFVLDRVGDITRTRPTPPSPLTAESA